MVFLRSHHGDQFARKLVGPLCWVESDETDHMLVTVKAFTQAQLRCMVRGEGRITTKWYEDGAQMSTSPPFHRQVSTIIHCFTLAGP